MNISWEWLTELVDLSNIKPEDVAEKLTLAGLEVDNISYNGSKGIILEISTTANREDALSIIGIAREISAVLDRPLILFKNKLPLKIHHQKISKNNKNHTYSIRGSITNITITHTPEWLKRRLKINNIEPINVLKDIQNFIYLKWAQHIDFFDSDSLGLNSSDKLDTSLKTGFRIRQEQLLKKNSQFITKNKLQNTTIHSSKNRIALARISTPAEYIATPKTTNLLLQVSKFNSPVVDSAAEVLNLYTQNIHSDKKNQKTIDLLDAYHECIFLITCLCFGSIQNTTYIHKNNYIYPYIKLPTQDIIFTLGSDFITSDNDLTSIQNISINILKKLRFIIWKEKQYLIIETPLDRFKDVSRGIDIIEEISRIHGFNKFTGTIPDCKKYGLKRIHHHRIIHIRSILRTVGLSEVIHSSLVERKYIEPIICNPVIKECHAIRSSLINSIINTYAYNLQQCNSPIEIFEIGRVFKYKNSQYEEAIHLCGMIGKGNNIRSKWQDNLRGLSWFEAKGIMEEIFERIGTRILWKPLDLSLDLYKEFEPYFFTASTSVLYCQNQIIGLFGTIKTPKFKLSVYDENVYGFEIFIDKMNYQLANTNYFKSYPKYPAVTRDVTVTIPCNISFHTVINEIQRINNPLIESVDLLNLYKNEIQYSGSKRLGFRIKYRSSSGTLTSETIENIENMLKCSISHTFTN
uniref:phenylalanine--tRNA ligase n=1 Tax=Acrochaetium secundatum TaxID=209631 RepID=A0A4D6BJY2_9FLOR|nr:Phenylalanine-tRNA ligase beta subunit [Acrochaetium secundatum]QBX88366.1 Phenylalanine-tRNA ligase beta subunit [Acrochaetium secundatum]